MSSPQFRAIFEARVHSAKNGALLLAALHLLSHFLRVIALTWASVVLLAGHTTSLSTSDFFLITALLLLEAARLFFSHAFANIFLSTTLFFESHRPEDFVFKDMQYIRASRLDIVGQAVIFIFALASLVSPAMVHSSSFGDSHTVELSAEKYRNLTHALYIFYGLVMVNSLLAILSTLLRPFIRSKCDDRASDTSAVKQNCLTCFHDEVYRTAMHAGWLEAHQLDILGFAFTKLASDYKRNIRPQLIKAHNKDLICYMYSNQQGIAMCNEYLSNSSDVWKQVVAANLPGFWVEEQRIEMQAALFWALRRRMCGAGKDAESALNSVECLGQSWATMANSKTYPFLINDPDAITTKNVVDTLVHLLLKPIRPTLLFQLRAFEACCRNFQVLQHLYGGRSPEEVRDMSQQLQAMLGGSRQDATSMTEESLQELCRKLFAYVSEEGIWMTTKIYAGNALLSLLCYGTGEVGEEAMEIMRGPVEQYIDPASARGLGAKLPYFWLNDMGLVEKMRKKLQMPRYGHWEGVRIRSLDGAELSLERALALVDGM